MFSRFIRIRDSDYNGTVQCCTCNKLLHWKEAHACHFVRRQHMAVRWDERNVHSGCVKCNVYQGGNLDEYAKFILERYGKGVFDELLAAKREIRKWSRCELEDLIAHYEQRTKDAEAKFILVD